MLLVVDVGNTHIVWGVYKNNELLAHWRVASNRFATEDEYAVILQGLLQQQGLKLNAIAGMAIASVVPPITANLLIMANKHLRLDPLVVDYNLSTGLEIKLDNPQEIGADRIVNCVAALRIYQTRPMIVVDFGTGTTFDCISEAGAYLGGAIAPGVGISIEALFSKAAKLPRVELTPPPQAIGTNTLTCLQSGCLYGFVGQVDGIVGRLQQELDGKALVIATGGLAKDIAPHTDSIDIVDEWLTLNGLRMLFQEQHLTIA